jgi:maltose/maltodextrin transport system permease protein
MTSGQHSIQSGISLPHQLAKYLALTCIDITLLYLAFLMYIGNESLFALTILVITSLGNYFFLSTKTYAHRYIFPAIVGMTIFILFPLLYTMGIAFTNYSGSNLKTYEQVTEQLKELTYIDESKPQYTFALYQDNQQFQLSLTDNDTEELLFTQPFSLDESEKHLEAASRNTAIGDKAPFSAVVKNRNALKQITVSLPSGEQVTFFTLRKFASLGQRYTQPNPEKLQDGQTGEIFQANFETGFYESATGERLIPGFTVGAGLDNFRRVVTDEGIRGPFFQIFLWTVAFAFLSVAFTFCVGVVLACLINWKDIKGSPVYRVLLILPYAVPAFISILIFRGLFNQSFGEINMLLDSLFGVAPNWFSDPWLARSMILIVNTWLGYPYMMILCIGMLQTISDDLYEASAIEGSNFITNFFTITLPQVFKPMIPLLIASFAFNFNNFVLIALLTEGNPDIIGATTPAGTTDLLVSYTYRIAFQSSNQDFALASAIATLIFILVGIMAWAQLHFTGRKPGETRA